MRTLHVVLLVAAMALTGCGGGGEDTAVTQATTAPATGDDAPTADEVAPLENPKEEAELDVSGDPGDDDPIEGPEDPSAPDDDVLEDDPEDVAEATQDTEPTGPPTEGLPGGRYVEIDTITASGSAYAVEFTPYNFVPLIGSGDQDFHVHFFWNSVEPQNAGTNSPSPGEWFLYDGGSPFTGYSFADRPPEATQLCALVADSAHGVTVGSGNCVTLP